MWDSGPFCLWESTPVTQFVLFTWTFNLCSLWAGMKPFGTSCTSCRSRETSCSTTNWEKRKLSWSWRLTQLVRATQMSQIVMDPVTLFWQVSSMNYTWRKHGKFFDISVYHNIIIEWVFSLVNVQFCQFIWINDRFWDKSLG